jgi:hypothetical protein
MNLTFMWMFFNHTKIENMIRVQICILHFDIELSKKHITDLYK